jgi:hypothetical protein
MEHATTWRSSLGARWLGWTVLYAVVTYGVLFSELRLVAPPGRGDEYAILILAALALFAFSIGVRFRSWWWVLGPPIGFSLPTSVALIASGWAFFISFTVAFAAVFAMVHLSRPRRRR